MPRPVSAPEVARMLADGREIAFIDVREITEFGTAHPLLAANLPLSRLELSIPCAVPRLATRIVLLDGGGGEADLAANRLAELGYADVGVLDGGARAWAAAGLALFQEIEVPAKGFGAFARAYGRPNFIESRELAQWLEGGGLERGEDCIVLDSRPRREYRLGAIPGAINAPGADLLRGFEDLVPDPASKVVVNCMSGTRGILGGLSLLAAGVPNEIRVLHHGTRGWLLDGGELEVGASRFTDFLTPGAVEVARTRAARVAALGEIPSIDLARLAAWASEGARTTYLFDVRTPRKFEAGHLAGAVNAPEGTLVMSPERYFATLGARFVLVDDDSVRATVTALWLTMMGWGEIFVLADGLAGADLAKGTPPVPAIEVAASRRIAPRELAQRTGAVRVVDVGHSDAYVAGHVGAAAWCSRTELTRRLGELGGEGPLVLTSEDGTTAALAAREVGSGAGEVLVLDGGIAAWTRAGLELEGGEVHLLSPRVDHWLASSERPGDVRRNVLAYLDWEVGLFDDIRAGGPVPYRNLIWT